MVSPGKVSSKLWTQTGPSNKGAGPGGCVVWGQTWVSGHILQVGGFMRGWVGGLEWEMLQDSERSGDLPAGV